MNRKRPPTPQDAPKVSDEISFADGRRHGEHQRDVRPNQVNLRVIFLSELRDAPGIDIRVMNQRVNHACEDPRTTVASRPRVGIPPAVARNRAPTGYWCNMASSSRNFAI